ncbi:UNVERIFIED_CONTAM: protein tesmin/TSO1-like CXC 5 [Sesamum radiatum]|uniref:Protein tesmin/TSO1-like CXC 5 n=1 Tax=Sesamum radiatum TaxID=300843 RepID=A0AAW2TT97_SESRA
MEQSEAAAAAPVVRQLDFSVSYNASTKANALAKGILILPEHPQAQLQSKLLALAQSQHLHARPSSSSPPQTKPPPRKVVAPHKSPPQELPQMVGLLKSKPIAPRLAHPVKPVKTESPKSRERCNIEPKDSTPKKQKQCNCKNSRCLKLYCECFAAGSYCDNCNCINCHNKIEHEADRKGSIDAILERNPNAFTHGATDGGFISKKFCFQELIWSAEDQAAATAAVEHKKGCNCKKSGCLKRYCECFQANILCSDKCKCMDCKNFEGSEEKKALSQGHPENQSISIQQAANAAINGAIGTPPSKKSRNHQIDFRVTSNEQLTSPVPQFFNCLFDGFQKFYVFLKLAPHPMPLVRHYFVSKLAASMTLEPSKPSYRAPLAGILQLQHVKDFCRLLVEVSAEAAQSLSEEKKMINSGMDVNLTETSVTSSHEDGKGNQSEHDSLRLCGNQENGLQTLLSESDGSCIRNRRPLSPETLALMCDEQDTVFLSASTPRATTESTLGLNPFYVEQERLVLMRFRSFLNRLITCGCIEGDAHCTNADILNQYIAETKIEWEANEDSSS